MGDIKTTVAKNILFYRKKHKLSQKALAEMIGVKHNTISSWESCTNSVDIDSLFKICNALNVSINTMIGIENSSFDNWQLSDRERQLISDFRNMSDLGKDYIIQTMSIAKNTYTQKTTFNSVCDFDSAVDVTETVKTNKVNKN